MRALLLTTALLAPAAMSGVIADDPTSAGAGGSSALPGGAYLQLYTSGPKLGNLPEVKQAQEHYRDGNFDATVALLTTARNRDSSLPPARVMLAWMFMSDRQLGLARAALERAVVEFPDEPRVYLTFGQVALAEGRLTDAELHLERTASLTPGMAWEKAQKTLLRAATLDGMAAVAERRQDWPGAAQALEQWLALEPDNLGARVRYGGAQFRLGREKAAFHSFEKAFQADVTLDPPEIHMATLTMAQGLQKETSNWLQKALKRHPKNPGVHQSMARWHLALDQTKAASKEAEKAAKLGDDSRRLTLLRGLIAHRLGDYAAAEGLFEGLHKAFPDDLVASTRLTLALAQQENPKKRKRAMRLAEANAQRFPRHPDVLATLGWVQYRLGQTDAAKQTLGDAASGGRLSGDTYYFVARVLVDEGQTEEAKQLLNGALRLTDASFSFRREAQGLLDSLN